MTVFRCEQGEVGIEAPGFGGALGQRRLPLGDTRPQCTEIVRRWSGWYERGHLRIIAGVRRPSLQGPSALRCGSADLGTLSDANSGLGGGAAAEVKGHARHDHVGLEQ